MPPLASAADVPRRRALVQGLRRCGLAVAVHGALLWLFSASGFAADGSDLAENLGFWALVVPALILASPFNEVFRDWGLLAASGWFAWPKPLGIVLAYVIWVAVLFGLAHAVQRCAKCN